MSWLRRLAWLWGLWVLLSASVAAAASASRGTILLIVDPRAERLATRVAAELESLGFTVLSQSSTPETSELAAAARGARAFAVIGIGPTTRGNVEITVLDRVTGKTVRRELLGRSLEDPTTRELVALRASELLRASLMEIGAPHPPRGDLVATADLSDLARAPQTTGGPSRRLRLGVESGVLLAPGLSAAPLLQASFGARVIERLELRLALGSQLTAGQRVESAGRIEALARWLSLGPQLLILPRRQGNRVALGIDVGGGLVALSAAGFAGDASYRGKSHFVWAAAVIGGIDSRIRLHEQLWWTLNPALGFTSTELILRADGRDIRIWGRPWLQCSMGLEVEL